MGVVGVVVGELYDLVSRLYNLDEILKRDTVAYGGGYVENSLHRWECHNYCEEDSAEEGVCCILKRVDECHFGEAEDHPSLDVFFLATSLYWGGVGGGDDNGDGVR